MGLANKFRTAWDMGRGLLRGWRCRQKVMVIQSDDWGLPWMPSREVWDRLASLGYPMTRTHYTFDALETPEDLRRLYDVLEGVRDPRGRPACLTANMIMANPDFRRVEEARFQQYFWEPVVDVLGRDPLRGEVPQLWADGLARGTFVPQFHGREHIRFWEWLDALRRGVREVVETFPLGLCGVGADLSPEGAAYLGAVFFIPDGHEPPGVNFDEMVGQGMALFEKQFGFRSLSIIAPSFGWSDSSEKVWARHGLRYIQSDLYQHVYVGTRRIRRPHYTGERNALGQGYQVRNCTFEAAMENGTNWVAHCLNQMRVAFLVGQPAVLSSHRVNFMGAIEPAQREKGLGRLAELLAQVRRRWPDVYFLSTPELGYMIEHGLDRVEQLGSVGPSGLEATGKAS